MGGRRPSFPGKLEGCCFAYERGLMTENDSSYMLILKRFALLILLEVPFPVGKDPQFFISLQDFH